MKYAITAQMHVSDLCVNVRAKHPVASCSERLVALTALIIGQTSIKLDNWLEEVPGMHLHFSEIPAVFCNLEISPVLCNLESSYYNTTVIKISDQHAGLITSLL